MSDEFSRIAEIGRRLADRSADVRVGIGDDAAVLAPSAAQDVVSVASTQIVNPAVLVRLYVSWLRVVVSQTPGQALGTAHVDATPSRVKRPVCVGSPAAIAPL